MHLAKSTKGKLPVWPSMRRGITPPPNNGGTEAQDHNPFKKKATTLAMEK